MQISNIKLQNFRCFKALEIKFEHTHALIGENGCGKTTILDAIAMATSSGLPYLNEQDFHNADQGDISIEVIFNEPFISRIPDGYTTQDVPCQSVLLTAHRRERAAGGKALSEPFVTEKYAVPLEYTSTSIPTISTGEISLNIPLAITKTVSGYESPRKTTDRTFKFTTNRLTLQNEMVNFPGVFYFDRDREEQAKVGYNSLLQKIAKDLNWRYRKEWNQTDISNKWNEFYQAVISTVENPKNGRVIEPIQEKLKKIARVEFSNLELGLLDIEQPFSHSFFSRRDGTNQIDQKRFGSGISILLAYFLLETISKLSKGKIVFLIDEPELHLHPQLQQSLFREFTSPEFQTIYTTQSDSFINIAEWQSVSRFQTDFSVAPTTADLIQELEGRILTEHLNEIKTWHQQESVFFKEDNQIFFARKCLLVEGPAEKYGLPVLAQKLEINLNNVTIISCNGKGKIPYYQLLCKSFGIPFFTLFDLDNTPVTEEDNKRSYDWATPSARHTFTTDFETILGVNASGRHKTSNVLIKIDGLEVSAIPQEIKDALISIDIWVKS